MSNPDYESYWIRERRMGWIFIALAAIGSLIYFYWHQSDYILAMTFYLAGLGASLIRLGIRGREQAETLQEREGEIDWALEKLRNGEKL